MKTLYSILNNTTLGTDNVSRIGPERIADILLSLCSSADKNELLPVSPKQIQIDNKGTLSYSHNGEPDPYYCAYEVVFNDQKPDRESGWFTLGLLIYFTIYGKSFYDDKNINLSDIPELKNNSNSLIVCDAPQGNDVLSLYKKAMEKLTAWNKSERCKGVQFLLRAVGTYSSVAEIELWHNNNRIMVSNLTIDKKTTNIKANTVFTVDKAQYKTTQDASIPFRPGTHTYKIKVVPANSTADTSQSPATISGEIQKSLHIQDLDTSKTREKDKSYRFMIAEKDLSTNTVVKGRIVYRIEVPADQQNKVSLLKISYHPSSGCQLELLHKDGITRLYDTTLRFNV